MSRSAAHVGVHVGVLGASVLKGGGVGWGRWSRQAGTGRVNGCWVGVGWRTLIAQDVDGLHQDKGGAEEPWMFMRSI